MSQSVEKKTTTLPAAERKSGRAVFDQGGTVWEWQTATGVFERHVSEEQLARLEHAGLQLVEQADPGRAIYGADQTGSQTAFTVRKRVFVGRPAPVSPVAPATATEHVGALRQFWRRLVPST